MRFMYRGSRAAGPAVRPALLLCGVAALLFAAAAAEAASDGIGLRDPWIRFIIPSRPAAGYFTLSNASDSAVTLIGASSPGCGQLMLHRSINRNGRDMMVMVKSIKVPAHGTVTFAPGGYHLMCMSPTMAIRPGQSVPVTLRFKEAGTITASFPVRGATGR